jgi:hypothetical protein
MLQRAPILAGLADQDQSVERIGSSGAARAGAKIAE